MKLTKRLKAETERIEKIVEFLIKRLTLDLNIIVLPMSPSAVKKSENSYFTIQRSGRASQDKNTFLLNFNQELVKDMHSPDIKRHIFHELVHTMHWPFTDEFEETIKYLKTNKPLFNELTKRHEDTRENVTYSIERKMGPLVIPEATWDKDE